MDRAGLAFGSHIGTIYDAAARYSTYLLAGLGALVIAYFVRRSALRRNACA